MSRVIAVMACGFMLAACSTTMPSLDFMKSAPQAESLAIESEPPGAEAKTSLGQSCRTPCQLSVQPGTSRRPCRCVRRRKAQLLLLHASRPTRFTWTCRRLRRKRGSWRQRPV